MPELLTNTLQVIFSMLLLQSVIVLFQFFTAARTTSAYDGHVRAVPRPRVITSAPQIIITTGCLSNATIPKLQRPPLALSPQLLLPRTSLSILSPFFQALLLFFVPDARAVRQ
jgi:hypothetical protein